MGEVWGKREGDFTSRGVMCWHWVLVVVLACVGMFVKLVEVGPIYAVAGICPSFCSKGGPECR